VSEFNFEVGEYVWLLRGGVEMSARVVARMVYRLGHWHRYQVSWIDEAGHRQPNLFASPSDLREKEQPPAPIAELE